MCSLSLHRTQKRSTYNVLWRSLSAEQTESNCSIILVYKNLSDLYIQSRADACAQRSTPFDGLQLSLNLIALQKDYVRSVRPGVVRVHQKLLVA